MAKVSDFQRFVLPFISNAPVPAVDDAVIDACVEFCTKTRVLTSMLDPMALLPGIGEYDLFPPFGDSVIVSVMACWLEHGQIKSRTRPELDEMYPKGWVDLEISDPQFVAAFYCRVPGVLRLVPKLSVKKKKAMTIEVAYAPSRNADEVDDLLYERYPETIAAGALGRLHQHPSAEYADPARVATYLEQFRSAIAQYADDSAHGFAHQPFRTGQDEFL